LAFNYMFHYSSMGAGAVVGTAIGGPLLGLGLLFSGGLASNVTRSQTGMNDITPKSGWILVGLLKNIVEVFKGTVDYLGDKCDFQPLTFEDYKWLADNELDESKISPKTIYIHSTQSSIECLYKDKKGIIKKHLLNDFLNESELLEMREQKDFGMRHKLAIITAIYKGICSPVSSEINQNKL